MRAAATVRKEGSASISSCLPRAPPRCARPQAGAAAKGVPLYRHIADLAGNSKPVLPVPRCAARPFSGYVAAALCSSPAPPP